MCMHFHITTLCSSLTYHLRNITRIRKLDFDTSHLIIRALILSRLDNGNGCLTLNMLKLNEEKTEFFIAVPDQLKSKVPSVSLLVGDKVIEPSENVHNLGVLFDSSMCMHFHIITLCSSLTYQLRNITRIRKLDFDTCHLIIRALILSRLDNGNGCSSVPTSKTFYAFNESKTGRLS